MRSLNSKWIITAVIAILLSSCSDYDDYKQSTPKKESNELLSIRSIDDAIRIVEMANSGDDNSRTTKRSINRHTVKVITDGNGSRSGEDTLIYAVDFNDNEGFALIAAPRNVEPLLAITEKGSFGDELTNSNQAFQYALQLTKNYVSSVTPQPVTPVPYDSYTDTIFPHPKMVPSVTVTWGQGWPENLYCPNKVAGCAPVAIAQILSYYERPTNWTYKFEERDVSNETVDWKEIKKHKKSLTSHSPTDMQVKIHNMGCGADADIHAILGRIVRQLGYDAESCYIYSSDITNASTATSSDNAIRVLKRATGITPTEGTTGNQLYNDLAKSNSPAYVRADGWCENPDDVENKRDMGGHAWIADAIWQVGMIINHYEYVLRPDQPNPGDDYIRDDDSLYELTYSEGHISSYIHFNWGWDGNSNGFFLEHIFNPSKGYEYDNSYPYHDNIDYDSGFHYWKF